MQLRLLTVHLTEEREFPLKYGKCALPWSSNISLKISFTDSIVKRPLLIDKSSVLSSLSLFMILCYLASVNNLSSNYFLLNDLQCLEWNFHLELLFGMKLLTILRLGLSHLGEHKLEHHKPTLFLQFRIRIRYPFFSCAAKTSQTFVYVSWRKNLSQNCFYKKTVDMTTKLYY